MTGLLFDWDPHKARESLRKHGISFEEAATVLADPREMVMHDEAHSEPGEDRFVSLGLSALGRVAVVVYCDRGARTRIISARLATRSETMKYLRQERR